MAKIRMGPLVGQASGSIGATTFSRNRFGTYVRLRSIPTVSTTPAASAVKAALGNVSQLWAGLTDAQRLQWVNYALANPVVDSLGQPQALTGHTAFVQLNARLYQHGDTLIDSPPVGAGPAPLTAVSLSLDIGAGAFSLIFAASPVPANVGYDMDAAVVDSAGINYVENLMRRITTIAAAQATPYDFQSDIEAIFGTLQVGQKVVVRVRSYDIVGGLVSVPLRASGLVITT